MTFDSLVTNPGRLTILTALISDETQEFVTLRKATRLTDGNLASHARRLHAGGLISIDKRIDAGKPVTRFSLTTQGRSALQQHARQLVAALGSMDAISTDALRDAKEDTQAIAAVEENAEETWVD